MKNRRHRRMAMMADLTIQPGDEKPSRFGGKVFNVSKGGLAVFSRYAFPPGKLVGVELIVPVPEEGIRRATLYGVTRWMQVQPDGNMLGIELLTGEKAGDYDWFSHHLDHLEHLVQPQRAWRGFTLVEVCIAMVIICLLMTLATPSFRSAIEQARVDNAVANLKTIWSAQRVYWLEYHAFSPQLSSLQTMDLIDSDVAASAGNPGAIYAYTVSSASASDFTAKAIRNGSTSWMGQLEIDCGGQVTGAIAGPSSQVLTPARQ